MLNIVVYGKPRAFESHEYCFDDKGAVSVDNSFQEPILKPKRFDDPVLHYYFRDGHAGLEWYTRAKGYESERDGIVFGVAIKTDHDFDIKNVVESILMEYWSDFASVLLDNEDRFSYPSILEVLNGTEWSSEDVGNIRSSVKDTPAHTPQKGICLLHTPDYNSVSIVESQLKEYADVYISANPDIFHDPINKVVLNLTNGKLHTIKNGSIVEVKEINNPPRRKKVVWGPDIEKPQRTDVDDGPYSPPPIDTRSGIGKGNSGIGKGIIGIIIAVVAITTILFFVIPKHDNNNKGGAGKDLGGKHETPIVEQPRVTVRFQKHDAPIKKSLNNVVQIYIPANSSIVCSDIVLDVSPNDIVKIEKDKNNIYNLIVDPKRPDQEETTVTINATLNGQDLGTHVYTIAKKETVKKEDQAKRKNNATEKRYENPSPKTIRFDKNRTSKTIFHVGDHVVLTAVDASGNPTQGGMWVFNGQDNNAIKHNTEKSNNPITIWAEKTGRYTIVYCFANNGNPSQISTPFVVQ